jgi:hypothetical protein
LSAAGRIAATAALAVYPAVLAAAGALRAEHLVFAGTGAAAMWARGKVRTAARFFVPLVLILAVYDAQRHVIDDWRGRIRVAEPLAWELVWFGIGTADGRLETPAAWWQRHTHPVLDVVCGAAYLGFVPAYLAAAAWWRFGRREPRAREAMWTLLALYLAGYALQFAYPAAPPWYVDRYGLGPAVLAAPPEAAGAARFDTALGVKVFAGYYGKSTNVFGAIPSLHVGTTFLGLLFAWRYRSLRVALAGLWAVTTFASVYLNHHYLVDGLAGMALAAAVFGAAAARGRRPPAENGLTSDRAAGG